jgi:hypothetical protein
LRREKNQSESDPKRGKNYLLLFLCFWLVWQPSGEVGESRNPGIMLTEQILAAV